MLRQTSSYTFTGCIGPSRQGIGILFRNNIKRNIGKTLPGDGFFVSFSEDEVLWSANGIFGISQNTVPTESFYSTMIHVCYVSRTLCTVPVHAVLGDVDLAPQEPVETSRGKVAIHPRVKILSPFQSRPAVGIIRFTGNL
jgi:hypothetical protein